MPLEIRSQLEREAALAVLKAAARALCAACAEGQAVEEKFFGQSRNPTWMHPLAPAEVMELTRRATRAEIKPEYGACPASAVHTLIVQVTQLKLAYNVEWRYLLSVEGGGFVLVEGTEQFAGVWGKPLVDYGVDQMGHARRVGWLFEEQQTRENDMNVVHVTAISPEDAPVRDEWALADLLTLVGIEFDTRDAAAEYLRGWGAIERRRAEDWAEAVHLAASDNDIEVPPRPLHTYDAEAASKCALCYKRSPAAPNASLGFTHEGLDGGGAICQAREVHSEKQRAASRAEA